MKKIIIIGAGNMGGALYTVLTLQKQPVYVCDTNSEKLHTLQVPLQYQVHDLNAFFSQNPMSILLLCIKPQSLPHFKDALQSSLSHVLIISILAGTSIEQLQQATGSQKVVRAMPNLGALAQASLTGWIASQKVSVAEKEDVTHIFRMLGDEVEVHSEDQINAITAIAGSGPAYFFYLVQLLEEQARAWGFAPAKASTIARQTLQSAAAVLGTNTKTPTAWKEAVTSPGGTTQAALTHLQQNDFAGLFQQALQKAKQRAEELSGIQVPQKSV